MKLEEALNKEDREAIRKRMNYINNVLAESDWDKFSQDELVEIIFDNFEFGESIKGQEFPFKAWERLRDMSKDYKQMLTWGKQIMFGGR